MLCQSQRGEHVPHSVPFHPGHVSPPCRSGGFSRVDFQHLLALFFFPEMKPKGSWEQCQNGAGPTERPWVSEVSTTVFISSKFCSNVEWETPSEPLRNVQHQAGGRDGWRQGEQAAPNQTQKGIQNIVNIFKWIKSEQWLSSRMRLGSQM